MADPQTIIRDGSGTQSASYQLPPGLWQYVQSVHVKVDNTAGGDIQPTLEVQTVNGVTLAANQQGRSIPAGDTGSATWALRLDDEGLGGIRYDVVNIGDWLYIDTASFGGPEGVSIALLAFADILLRAPDGVNIESAADGLNLDAGTATYRLRGAFMNIDLNDAGSFVNVSCQGVMDFNSTGNLARLRSNLARITMLANGDIQARIATGRTFTVEDHNGNPIFRVSEDGSLQGKTGKALTFNL